jgi:hypothetical protein
LLFDDRLDHRQAQSAARIRSCIPPAVKTLEQEKRVLRENADAGILHPKYSLILFLIYAYTHRAARWGKFYRVVEQVRQGLAQLVFIALDFDLIFRRRKLERNPGLLSARGVRLS